MILRPDQIRLLRLGLPAVPANGGSSKSDSSTSSNTQNTNDITTEDRRVVASDAAVAVSGNGNMTSRTESTSFTDSSDRSTNFSDSSVKDAYNSTSITNTTTDFGAISKGMEGISMMGQSAVGLGDTSVTGAIDVLKQIASQNLAVTTKAMDLARSTSADSSRTVDTVAAFANKQTATTAAAFEAAEFGPDQTKFVMWVAMAAVGAIALPAILKKG